MHLIELQNTQSRKRAVREIEKSTIIVGDFNMFLSINDRISRKSIRYNTLISQSTKMAFIQHL